MAKIKNVDGYQKKKVTEEQVELYRPFGWEKEKNSKEIVKKQTMYTVKRREAIGKNKAIVAGEKKYLKLEKKICKRKPGFFSVVFFIVGLALVAIELLSSTINFSISAIIAESVPAIADYASIIVMALGAVIALICLFCPSGKPKYGKYKKGKQKKLFPKMVALADKAGEDLYKMKVENKSLMSKKESKNYDMQTVIKRAIKEIREEDDD